MPYFERLAEHRFRATEHVGGAWSLEEQHVAPSLGLLAHLVETDHAERRPDDRLQISRLSYDIFGTMPVGEVETSVRVVRPGRTIELVEAMLSASGRDTVVLRAWLLAPGRTEDVAGTPWPSLEPPAAHEPWDPTTVWRGGFIASAEVRRRQVAPGRASFWVRLAEPLLADEPVSTTARVAGIFDIANGMTVREDPEAVAFPNVDLTAHLLREPVGEWLGFDTSVSFGPTGVGLTDSVLHDEVGPLGSLAQSLTVRPVDPSRLSR